MKKQEERGTPKTKQRKVDLREPCERPWISSKTVLTQYKPPSNNCMVEAEHEMEDSGVTAGRPSREP